MSEYYDTFFLNSKRALRIAKQKNDVKLYNGWGTQICYYSGETIENSPENLICLPLDNVKEFFFNNSFRLPEYIDFNKSSYNNEEELQINYKNIFLSIFKEMREEENIRNDKLLNEIKKQAIHPIIDNKLVFVIIVSRTLKYNYYYSKQLKKSLEKLGHDVTILTEDGSKKTLITQLKTNYIFSKILNLKPNVVFFINDFKPEILSENILQISLFNGFISLLNTISSHKVRKNDIILSQNSYVNTVLKTRNIQSSYLTSVIKPKKNQKLPERKYLLSINNNYFDLSSYIVFQKIITKLFKTVNKEIISIELIKEYVDKTNYQNKNDYEIMLYLQKNVLLQSLLKWINPTLSTINLIGQNWTKKLIKNENITLRKKKNPLSLYKQSKYVLHISANIIDVNLLEVLNSGAIPIVYDLRQYDINYNHDFDEYCLFFKNKDELNKILENQIKPRKDDTKELFETYSFNNLSKTIESLVLKHYE